MYNAFGAAKLQTFFRDRLLQGLVFWGQGDFVLTYKDKYVD